jgi:hypothetical protein
MAFGKAARAALPRTLTLTAAALAVAGGALATAGTAAAATPASPSVALAASVAPLNTAPASYLQDHGYFGYRCEWRNDRWRDEGGRWHQHEYGYWDNDHRWHDNCDDDD